MLHGELKVNGRVIATWEARRLVDPPQERNDYEVWVEYIRPDHVVFEPRGVISHRFGDGALVLASEVTAWAAAEVARLD